jgi:HAD superfamily hydrolase (TIGR01509 family)
MVVRALAVDMDDTLVHSGGIWEESWRACTERYGYRWTEADSRHITGAALWSKYIGRICGIAPEAVEDFVADHVVQAIGQGRVTALDGATDLVADAAQSVPVAVVTGAPRRIAEAALTQLGFQPHLTTVVAHGDAPEGKPSPDPYLEAAARLGVEGRDVVAVEDSRDGIRAAHAAGMTVVAVPNRVHRPAPEVLDLAGYVVPDTRAAARLVTGLIEASRAEAAEAAR